MARTAPIQSQELEPLPGLPVDAGSQGFEPFLTAFPGHKQGAGWEARSLGLELDPIWDPGMFKARTLAARPSHQALFCVIYMIRFSVGKLYDYKPDIHTITYKRKHVVVFLLNLSYFI